MALPILTKILFCKEKKALAFNWDRCCHLVFCYRLILFNFDVNEQNPTIKIGKLIQTQKPQNKLAEK
jgi:hypothetical protein